MKEVLAKTISQAIRNEKDGIIYQVYEMTEPPEKENVGFNK